MNILDVIGTDLKAAGVWIEKEAGVVLTAAETAADTALKDVWGVAKTIFTTAEPVAVSAVLGAIQTFLKDIQPGQDLATIEAAFLNEAEKLGGELLGQAQGLGSMLLQALIAMALKAL